MEKIKIGYTLLFNPHLMCRLIYVYIINKIFPKLIESETPSKKTQLDRRKKVIIES